MTLVLGFAAQIVIYFCLAVLVAAPTAVAILLFLMGFAGFVVNAPLQNRVLRGAAEAPDLASTLISHDLIDEFRICVAPVLLGQGTPLFNPSSRPHKLKLLDARPLSVGAVILRYVPA